MQAIAYFNLLGMAFLLEFSYDSSNLSSIRMGTGDLAKYPFLNEAAETIDRPVLMINQSEDEIFSRASTFRLYDALSGPKRVFFYPGGHSGVPREAMERTREFLHAHLAGDGAETDAPRGTW